MQKTNAMRILDKEMIPYEIVEYEIDDDLRGVHTADKLNLSYEVMFKTLVLKDNKKNYYVCVIPVAEELDLKKTAKHIGIKNIEMIPMKDLLSVCGYVRGACSPIGMKKNFPTYVDETCLLFDEIYVSAGIRGCMLKLKSEYLISFTKAICLDLTV